jgi:hypothetical protein
MNAISKISDGDRYARCISTSKRVRWDLDEGIVTATGSGRRGGAGRD